MNKAEIDAIHQTLKQKKDIPVVFTIPNGRDKKLTAKGMITNTAPQVFVINVPAKEVDGQIIPDRNFTFRYSDIGTKQLKMAFIDAVSDN